MGIVLRYQWESYMDCGEVDGEADFQLIGEGFTTFPESKNPETYSRRYYDKKTSQTDVTGYSPSMSYSCDMITGDPVISKIVSITDNELVGEATHVDIVSVNLWNETEREGVYVAYKRTYAIIPSGKGEGTGTMGYSGSMEAVGDIVKGVFIRGMKIFKPDQETEEEDDDDSDNSIRLESRTVSPSEKVQIVSPGEGYNGLAKVIVEPITAEEVEVTLVESSEILSTDGFYIKKVKVNVVGAESYIIRDGDGNEIPATVIYE